MDLHRSSFYAAPTPAQEDPVIGIIRSIAETCLNYGYRRVTAELRPVPVRIANDLEGGRNPAYRESKTETKARSPTA